MGCFCAKIYVMLKQLRENCNYFNIATENPAAAVEKSTNRASEESVQAPSGLLCAGSRPAEAEVAQDGLRSRRRHCSCRRSPQDSENCPAEHHRNHRRGLAHVPYREPENVRIRARAHAHE